MSKDRANKQLYITSYTISILCFFKGVYEAISTTQAEFMGAFSVRLLGWGTENKKDYWLGSNNWGKDWGDKGFFKILRGVNHLHIEETVTAGMPDFNRTRVKP